jgi:hypothetical protein
VAFHRLHFVGETRTKTKGLGHFQATFFETLDRELAGHLKLLESFLFGLTCPEVRQFAYHLAERKGIERRFSRENNGWMGLDSWL